MRQDSAQRDRTTDLGVIRINNDVIASIAATEVKGVRRMGGGFGKTLYEMLMKRTSAKGVRTDNTDNEIKLTVSVVVDYGVDIPKIADEVQDNVKRSVEKMTGLVLSEVDVVVEGVESSVGKPREGRA